MKKCVKKIPKYGNGIPGATAPSPQEQFKSMNARVGGPTSTISNGNIAGGIAGSIAGVSGAVANAFGIEQGKNAAIFNMVGDVASMIPGVGQFLGPALKTVGAFAGEGGGVDQNTGEVTKSSGLTRLFGWGRDDKAMAQESNRIKMANLSKSLTENLKTNYYNNTPGAGSINVLAAEGGIMRQPVDALVSKGELIYNPVTQKLSQVPGSKGKPNKADDVYAKLYEGDVVISNSPTMLMANGKTPAQNLMGMVDKYATGGTVKAREAIIKKVVNWQEANKTKPQEYAVYDEGTGEDGITSFVEKAKNRGKIVAQTEVGGKTYVKLGDGNWYNTVNGEVGKRVIKNNKLRKAFAEADLNLQQNAVEKATKTNDVTVPNSNYNQNWESDIMKSPMAQALFGQNKKYNLFEPLDVVERAGYNYGPTYSDYKPDLNLYNFSDMLPALADYKTVGRKNGPVISNKSAAIGDASKSVLYNYTTPTLSKNAAIPETLESLPIERATGLMDNYDKDVDSAYKSLRNNVYRQKLSKFGKNINGYLPLIGAILNKPKYHKEETIISPAKYISTGVNIDPIRKAADESFAMARYNQSNITPYTGAGMAHGLHAASDRAKSLADAYKWQQEQQNKLIAQNVGIYNNQSNRYDAAKYKAIENTMANEAAADAQKDVRIKDAMGYLRDWQLTPFLKQYLSSGAYKENVERIS